MSNVRENAAYQQYREIGKEELNLPEFEVDVGCPLPNYWYYVVASESELKTRYRKTQFVNTNNLKKHLIDAHNDEINFFDGGKGGRPCRKDEDLAISFYEKIIRNYGSGTGADKEETTRTRTAVRWRPSDFDLDALTNEDINAIEEEMHNQYDSFIKKHGRLPRTGEEDPWIDELGEFAPGLRRQAQRFGKGS